MTGFKSILVPLDGSPPSKRALSGATALAATFRSQVILLHVGNVAARTPPTLHPEVESGWMNVALACASRKARQCLDEHEREIGRQGIAVRTLMCDRPPCECILDAASSQQIDLIVMYEQAQEELARWSLGGIAGKVAGQSPCPVLLTR
ncbi:MAG: universal stress protein [Anaerolineae bacterium]|nr:universal stress protein [Anaerolineae bacterium]